jgi:hypothetical protein
VSGEARRVRQAQVTIDTLEYVKKLEAVGVDRRHAEAHAQAIRDTLAPQLATKADLDAAVARLEGKTDTAVSRLDAIESRLDSIDGRLRRVETEVAVLRWMLATNLAGTMGVILLLLRTMLK